MTGGQDFWSRRKAEVRAEEERDRRRDTERDAARERERLEQRDDDEILAELNLPDPDRLKPGDDFSAFMSSAVPERLRRRALRKLWRSNPVLANLDEMVDYGEDFNSIGIGAGAVRTAYRVGKGMLNRADAASGKPEGEVPPGAEDDDTPQEVSAALAGESPLDARAQDGPAEAEEPEREEATTAPAPRRMRFSFEA